MRTYSNSKGLTLIEILIALAILGIVTVVFLTGFTGAFASIMSMGRKTTAMAEAQTIIDKIYESGTPTETFIESLGAEDEAFTDPYVDGSDHIRYELGSKSVGGQSLSQVSILVFYQNGTRSVTLTALIP